MQPDIVFNAFPKGEAGAGVQLLIDGKLTPRSAIGATADEALHQAIRELLPHDGEFRNVTTETFGATTNATADMYVGDVHVLGEGVHQNPFVAKAKAIAHAVAKIRDRSNGSSCATESREMAKEA